MKFVAFSVVSFIILPNVISLFDFLPTPDAAVNLTHWREHRRKKRFILYENSGVSKMITSFAFPIDFGEKKNWRQLSISYALHYQFPVPLRPIYWWNKWSTRNLPNEPAVLRTPESLQDYKDEAQEFLYELAENLMERWGMNGRACVQRLICENAQIHINRGLYAKILHRFLQPQRNLKSAYTEAWRLGKRGGDCRTVYAEATKCLLDDYIHVREDFQQQHFVIARGRT